MQSSNDDDNDDDRVFNVDDVIGVVGVVGIVAVVVAVVGVRIVFLAALFLVVSAIPRRRQLQLQGLPRGRVQWPSRAGTTARAKGAWQQR